MDFMRVDFCRDKARLSARLSDDFIEFTQSGRRAYKADIVEALSKIAEDRKIAISDFKVRRISDGAVLATYRAAEESGRISNRSSAWIEEDGQWKLLFHQGTSAINK